MRLDRQHTRRPAVLTLLLVVVGLGVGALGVGLGLGFGYGLGGRRVEAAAAAVLPIQETTTSRPEILVPGPTVAPTTTVAATTTTAADDDGGLTDRVRDLLSDETGRTVAIAIGGLLLVALALAILTVRYWRKTRPVPTVSSLGRTGRARGQG
jgi:hypothetical protein